MQPITLVIGDIHGCFDELKALIAKAGPVDTVISVGDLIDRGLKSLEVVKYCIDNDIQVCLGNHELMFMDAMKDYLGPSHDFKRMGLMSSDWWANGGKQVFNQCSTEDLQFMYDYFKSLPLCIKTDYMYNELPVVISHTCLNIYKHNVLDRPYEDLYKEADSLVWSRTQSIDMGHFFNIYGHTPTDYLGIKGAQPRITRTGINLDTGCCYSTEGRGVLTGVLLPSMKIIQQERL